jgi:fluoride exporter
MMAILCVALGGACGSVCRYLCSLWIPRVQGFPLATVFVNVLGCLLIGVLSGYLARLQLSSNALRLLLVTGFCGGFTTFSTFTSENISLIQNGQWGMALFNMGASLFAGLLACALGFWIVSYE